MKGLTEEDPDHSAFPRRTVIGSCCGSFTPWGIDQSQDAGSDRLRPRILDSGQIGVRSPSGPSGGTERIRVRRAHQSGHSPGHDSRLQASVYGIRPSGVNWGPARNPGALPSRAVPDPLRARGFRSSVRSHCVRLPGRGPTHAGEGASLRNARP